MELEGLPFQPPDDFSSALVCVEMSKKNKQSLIMANLNEMMASASIDLVSNCPQQSGINPCCADSAITVTLAEGPKQGS